MLCIDRKKIFEFTTKKNKFYKYYCSYSILKVQNSYIDIFFILADLATKPKDYTYFSLLVLKFSEKVFLLGILNMQRFLDIFVFIQRLRLLMSGPHLFLNKIDLCLHIYIQILECLKKNSIHFWVSFTLPFSITGYFYLAILCLHHIICYVVSTSYYLLYRWHTMRLFMGPCSSTIYHANFG